MGRKGLSEEEAKEKLEKFGFNVLPEKPPPSWLAILFDQLKSPLIYVLLFAAFLTLILKHFSDTAIILIAVVLNTVLGFYQERKAKYAVYALKKLLVPQARVIRDGKRLAIDARQLVPGDLVVLEIGDRVPADGILLEATDLALDEAILTGEAIPVYKKVQDNCYLATIIIVGRGLMEVTKTGGETKVGKIAERLEEKEEITPLEKKVSGLAKALAILFGGTTLFVFLSGVILGKDFLEMLAVAAALAVAAIPEGLVVSLTVVLAIGMQRILKQKALVRRLMATETLGSVTTICVDKTGTLTEGKMRVVEAESQPEDLDWLIKAAVLCNNLRDPLEFAMKEWAEKKSKIKNILEEYPRLDEIPFSPKTKMIATLHPGVLFVSGAPEVILERCQFSEEEKRKWLEKFEEYGQKGLRLVGFGYKKGQGIRKVKSEDLRELSWLGVLLYEDPVRPSVETALEACQKAGIKIKIITGDYLITSMAVLRNLGLKIGLEQTMEGSELERLSAKELGQKIGQIILFARADPFQKLKIVEALKIQGEVVAMTGDGVNDALALQKADVGIVVKEASEVAKETADMVLLDSNFKTIVAAVEEGRGIFANFQKIILYLLSDAFAGITIIFGALLLDSPLPLMAGQLLWINLISDGFPALALTVDPKSKGLMQEKPINPKENLLNFEIKALIALVSLFAGLSTLLIFFWVWQKTADLTYARSLAFALLGANSLFYVFSCRSLRRPVWQTDFFNNRWLLGAVIAGFLLLASAFYFPPLAFILRTTPLGIFEWGIIMAAGLAVVLLIETTKFIFMLKSRNNHD